MGRLCFSRSSGMRLLGALLLFGCLCRIFFCTNSRPEFGALTDSGVRDKHMWVFLFPDIVENYSVRLELQGGSKSFPDRLALLKQNHSLATTAGASLKIGLELDDCACTCFQRHVNESLFQAISGQETWPRPRPLCMFSWLAVLNLFRVQCRLLPPGLRS